MASLTDRHLPDSDDIVGVTSKQCLTISGPSHREALGRISLAGLGVLRDNFVLKLVDHGLAFQIPNLDRWTSGGAKPIAVGREAKSIDDVSVVQGVQTLIVVQVPEHGLAVL